MTVTGTRRGPWIAGASRRGNAEGIVGFTNNGVVCGTTGGRFGFVASGAVADRLVTPPSRPSTGNEPYRVLCCWHPSQMGWVVEGSLHPSAEQRRPRPATAVT